MASKAGHGFWGGEFDSHRPPNHFSRKLNFPTNDEPEKVLPSTPFAKVVLIVCWAALVMYALDICRNSRCFLVTVVNLCALMGKHQCRNTMQAVRSHMTINSFCTSHKYSFFFVRSGRFRWSDTGHGGSGTRAEAEK